MALRRYLHHLYDVYNGEIGVDWNRDRHSIITLVGLTILTGFLLPAAWWIQQWCAASAWDHEDRWEGTKQFAIMLLLLFYIPLMLNLAFFHVSFIPWTHFTQIHARFNLLAFAWYAGLWWIVLLPLAPTLALILEHIDPRTRSLERVVLPREQLPPSQPVGDVQKMAKSTRKKATANGAVTTPKKRKKGRARPLGELLLEEKTEAEQKQQVEMIQKQPPLPNSVEQLPTTEASGPSSSTSFSSRRPDRGNYESLKDLF